MHIAVSVMQQGTKSPGFCPTSAFYVCLLGAWECYEACEPSSWLLQQAEAGRLM